MANKEAATREDLQKQIVKVLTSLKKELNYYNPIAPVYEKDSKAEDEIKIRGIKLSSDFSRTVKVKEIDEEGKETGNMVDETFNLLYGTIPPEDLFKEENGLANPIEGQLYFHIQ